MQVLDVGLVEIELADRGRDLGVRQDAELRAAVDKALDLFEFLKFSYRHLIPFLVACAPPQHPAFGAIIGRPAPARARTTAIQT